MMVALGTLVIVAAIYLMLKRYDSRLVLIGAGLLMAAMAGKPLTALDAFAKEMANGGLITSVCSVMGFAMVMKFTGCDKHLICILAGFLKKVRPLLIPGTTLITFVINIALPSAAGCSAAVGAIFIPILMSSGVHPAMAAAAVKSGTFGSMLSPGLMHNGVIAKLANVGIMDVIQNHMVADIVAVVITAVSITILAHVMKENSGHVSADAAVADVNFKSNPLYALMPILPVIILVLGSTGTVPMFKMGVPHAMVIGAIVALIVTRCNPTELTKAFFNGMGNGYGDILSIIISVGVFVSGMKALGLVSAFLKAMLTSEGVIKIAAAFGPFILGMISGSGDAATVAFNESITPHAAQFGISIIDMGSIAALGGTLGRTMSPIAGATIICAGIAGCNPIEVAKRNALGVTIALIAGMFILL